MTAPQTAKPPNIVPITAPKDELLLSEAYTMAPIIAILIVIYIIISKLVQPIKVFRIQKCIYLQNTITPYE